MTSQNQDNTNLKADGSNEPPEAERQPVQPKDHWRLPLLLAAFIAAFIAAFYFFSLPNGLRNTPVSRISSTPTEPVTGTVDDEVFTKHELARLSYEVDALSQRLIAMETGQGSADIDIRKLAQRFEQYEQRLYEIESDILSIRSELRSADMSLFRAALQLPTAYQLKEVIKSGRRFVEELAMLEKAMKDNLPTEISAHLAILKNNAETGVPTAKQLANSFPSLANAALEKAWQEETKDLPWWKKLIADIGSTIKIRKVGEVSGSTTEAVIARAEYAAENGDISKAVSEVKGLDAPKREIFVNWMADAEKIIKANTAIEEIIKYITANLLRDNAATLKPSNEVK